MRHGNRGNPGFSAVPKARTAAVPPGGPGCGNGAALVCCLFGFDVSGVAHIERLADRARPQLTVDWQFQPDSFDACDLLLCDIDMSYGAQAWENANGLVTRAAATVAVDPPDGLVLRKPVRTQGTEGLIHVLNEAARLRHEGGVQAFAAGSAANAPPAASASLLTRLRLAVRSWFPSRPAAAPAQASAAAAASPAPPEPAADVPLWASTAPDHAGPAWRWQDELEAGERMPEDADALAAPAPEMEASLRHPEPSYGVPAVRSPVLVGEILPDAPFARMSLAPRHPAAPEQDAVVDTRGCDLLMVLRQFRSVSRVAVLRFDNVPTICVAPDHDTYYTLAPLQNLFEAPARDLVPRRVTIARNSRQGRAEAQAYDPSRPDGEPGTHSYFVSMPGLPIRHLFWVATLRCGGPDEVARYSNAAFSFKVWPDLATLPHEHHHVTWCGLLSRQPVNLFALAKATAHPPTAAAAFLAACDELGILERTEGPGGMLALGYQPSERATVFRNVLKRLGLDRK